MATGHHVCVAHHVLVSHVLVRQGDLLAELFVKPARDHAGLRALAGSAAAFICDAPVC